jgi:hypothetical protein
MNVKEPRSVKTKLRGCKLRSGANWQGGLKENKGVKQTGVKQGLGYCVQNSPPPPHE